MWETIDGWWYDAAPVAVLPLDWGTPMLAASTSASSSSATVGEIEGVMFFLLELSELERRRMNRLARLALLLFPIVGLVGLDPPETDPLFLSLCPLALLASASESPPSAALAWGDNPALAKLVVERAAGDVL
jgi:hypothetical protein